MVSEAINIFNSVTATFLNNKILFANQSIGFLIILLLSRIIYESLAPGVCFINHFVKYLRL